MQKSMLFTTSFERFLLLATLNRQFKKICNKWYLYPSSSIKLCWTSGRRVEFCVSSVPVCGCFYKAGSLAEAAPGIYRIRVNRQLGRGLGHPSYSSLFSTFEQWSISSIFYAYSEVFIASYYCVMLLLLLFIQES